ncbi:MAG: hypothetical protein Kow00120_00740 [Anaerolineae bacterium]
MVTKARLFFVSGFGAGLAASALVMRAAHPPDAEAVARRYRGWARLYHWVGVTLQERLVPARDRLAEMARLRPGGRVLDLACGTGGNLPFIRERVGPGGYVVGVDCSPDMLAQARALIDARGWENVRLVRADAAALDLGARFDAVLCSFGLSAIPDCASAMARALAHLEPGGTFAALDGRLSGHPVGAPLSHFVNLMTQVAGGDLSRRPWEWLAAHTTDFQYEEKLLGALYLAAGRRPIYI